MMTKDGSGTIVNFMGHLVKVLMLGRGHYYDKV